MSALEISANAVITVSIWLAARNHVYTWPTGIAGCALFSVVFLRNQLYADATLQLFFIATCVIGWWQWFHPTTPTSSGERPITTSKRRTIVWMVIAGIAVTACYGSVSRTFPLFKTGRAVKPPFATSSTPGIGNKRPRSNVPG